MGTAPAAQLVKSRGQSSDPGCLAAEFTASSLLIAAAAPPRSWSKTPVPWAGPAGERVLIHV